MSLLFLHSAQYDEILISTVVSTEFSNIKGAGCLRMSFGDPHCFCQISSKVFLTSDFHFM